MAKDESEDSAADGSLAVKVNLPRAFKHRDGYTVYQVDVNLPATRQGNSRAARLASLKHGHPGLCGVHQAEIIAGSDPDLILEKHGTLSCRKFRNEVWCFFRRYREFVGLRQKLEAECKLLAQQQHHQAPRQLSKSPSPNTQAQPASITGVAAGSTNAQGPGLQFKVSSGKLTSRKKNATGMALPTSPFLVAAESIQKALAAHRLPSKITLPGTAALRKERQRVLNGLLGDLVKIRPLPRALSEFLGLLQDDRLCLDSNGNYAQVVNVDSLLPLPPSPGRPRQDVASEQALDVSGANRSSSSSPVNGKKLSPIHPRSRSPPTTRDVGASSTIDRRERGSRPDAPRRERGLGERQPGVSTRGWLDATPPRGGAGGNGEQEYLSETDEPTDDSEPEVEDDEDFFDRPSRSRGTGTAGGTRLEVVEGDAPKGTGASLGRAGKASEREGRRDPSEKGVSKGTTKTPGDSVEARGTIASGRDSLAGGHGFGAARNDPDPGGVARLRGGGGGGGDPGDDCGEEDVEDKDWSFVSIEEGDDVGTKSVESDPKVVSGTRRPGAPSAPSASTVPADAVPSTRESDAKKLKAGQGGGKDAARSKKEGKGGVEVDGGTEEERPLEFEELDHGLQEAYIGEFFERVILTVVKRKDLEDGSVPAKDREKHFPLTTDEQNLRMVELMSLGVDLPQEKLLALLRYKDWGPNPATALYQNLVAAGKGSLEKVTPGSQLRGMENGGNTCYIDSLLFAMFATVEAFDWLLRKQLPATDPREVVILQKHLRFLVSQLRRGAVIPREHSNLIRHQLRSCGWQGGASTQEDVSELFTFLVTLLRCPALPLSEALFHGGKSESTDSRVSTERALFLALPEDEENDRPRTPKAQPPAPGTRGALSSSPRTPVSRQARGREDGGGLGGGNGEKETPRPPRAVTLEQILMHNFHDNRVEGLKRTVSGEKGSQPVDAWRMVSMLPFYALSGEYAADSDPSNDLHFDTVMLPMVLKRYEAVELPSTGSASQAKGGQAQGQGKGASQGQVAKRSRKEVVVPLRLDCSKFMTPADGGKEGPLADHGRFVLLLRSAICHLGGESVNKGHYVAYAADRYRNSGRGDRGRPTSAGGVPAEEAAKAAQRSSKEQSGSSGHVPIEQKPGSSLTKESLDGEESVAWLRLDDLKRIPGGRGFVDRVEGVHDADRLFSEDLGLHSYVLFYELVALNLDDVGKAQIEEACSLIITQQDYEYALRVYMNEKRRVMLYKGARSNETCTIC